MSYNQKQTNTNALFLSKFFSNLPKQTTSTIVLLAQQGNKQLKTQIAQLQLMQSDILEGDLYKSGTSSDSYLIESDNEQIKESQGSSKLKYFEMETKKVQREVRSLYRLFQLNDIIVSKCFVPPELLNKKQELLQKIKRVKLEQIQLNQEAMAIDLKIAKIQAELKSSSQIQQLLKVIEPKPVKEQISPQVLKEKFDKYAKEETDLEIEANLKALDNELQIKKKSDAKLIEFYTKKIKEQKEAIEKLRKRRKEHSNRLQNKVMADIQHQEMSRREKDQRLIEDRAALLQASIATLKKNLQKN